jgi:hypothetical protein
MDLKRQLLGIVLPCCGARLAAREVRGYFALPSYNYHVMEFVQWITKALRYRYPDDQRLDVHRITQIKDDMLFGFAIGRHEVHRPLYKKGNRRI